MVYVLMVTLVGKGARALEPGVGHLTETTAVFSYDAQNRYHTSVSSTVMWPRYDLLARHLRCQRVVYQSLACRSSSETTLQDE